VTYQLDVLQARLDARGIAAPYADGTVWQEQLLGGRLEELQAILAEEPAPALNRDLAPRCYYFEAQRWSALQRTRLPGARPAWLDLGRLLEWLDRWPAVAPLAILGLLAAVSLAVPLVRRRGRDAALAFAIASSGLIEMGVEFVVLLGFQVAYGYVYHYIGVLVASFMVGLTAGGWVGSRWVRGGRATWRRLAWVQGGLCAYPLALLGFLMIVTRTGLGEVPLVAALLFSGVAATSGLVGGLQFPMAASRHSAGEAAAGTLYGLDLFGACLGALAVSSVLVPTFGLASLCLMLSALAALGLAGLVVATDARGG
jgi:spermidine synthase